MSVQSQIDRIEQNVANTYNVLDGLGADMPTARTTDNLPNTAASIKAVRYDEQTLTEEQKAQVRENIGVVDGMPYIVGNGTTTGAWTGTSDRVTAYIEGLTILFKINVAGISGGSTLDINGLGALPVNRNASTAVTTIYPVGSVIMLTYSDGAWLTSDYDANTKNSAGTSNKADTKMYLVGATSQTSSGTTTYTNTKVYIGTDNRLYSNGVAVPTDSEEWVFELEGGSTVTKKVVLG